MNREIENPLYTRTRLAADAMYYFSAVEAYARAEAASAEIKGIEQRIAATFEKERRAYGCLEGLDTATSIAHYNFYEASSIHLVDSLHPQLEEAHAPQIAALAHVHIFCAAALEAHVNTVAERHLSRAHFEAFDKLALTGKWLFLPSVLGKQLLDPGTEPVQSVKRLSSVRNNLLHYKPVHEEWHLGKLPQFILDLRLTMEEGKRSLDGVRTAVARLAGMVSRPEPRWLRHRPSRWLTSDQHEDLVDSPPLRER